RVFSAQLKQALFKADPTCVFCGQRIQDIDDAAVDHIEPYWLGGRTIDSNARLLHRYCNWRRGGGRALDAGEGAGTVDGPRPGRERPVPTWPSDAVSTAAAPSPARSKGTAAVSSRRPKLGSAVAESTPIPGAYYGYPYKGQMFY